MEQDTSLILQEPFYWQIKALDQNSHVRKRLQTVYKNCFLKYTVLLSLELTMQNNNYV